MSLIGIVVLLAQGSDPAQADEFYHDFRTAPLNRQVFRLVGPEADRYIHAKPEGLAIKLPSGRGQFPPIGVGTKCKAEGDFEITVAFEAVRADNPDTGYGAGAVLYIQMESANKEAASFSRIVSTKGETAFVTDRMQEVNGK